MDWRHQLLRWTRFASFYLFWPGVLLIVWGELTPNPPGWTDNLWDKGLHFTAYFGLAAMATVVLGARRRTLWAVLGLIALGGILEVLQGVTGRDPDILDACANSLGALSGAAVGLLFLRMLGRSRVSTASANS